MMATTLKKLLTATSFALAATALCVSASATENHSKHKAKPAAKAKKAEAETPAEPEPDLTDSTSIEYACELGNKVTIYTNERDDSHIALRWQKRLHRLDRVGTTTGAQRFENTKFGLVWIGIPSKGILLDSKQNHQLANDCKTAAQARPAAGA